MNVTPSTVSLERLVPDALDDADATGKETLALHMARYRFAAGFVKGGRILDCACGVGYGTAILAGAEHTPEHVLGVDIDAAAVEYATNSYASERIRFLQSDGCKLKDPVGFETIVSLETVEHVPEPSALFRNFWKLLRPGGTLIASVPVTPSVDVNPYHLHDFTSKSFRSLGADLGLKEIDSLFQVQPFSPLKIVSGQEARLEDMRKNMAGYYFRNPTAFSKRLISTVVDGFCNKYLTIAWIKPA